jgi:threonine synthase
LLVHGARDAQSVVCVLTGHGLKDPQTALAQQEQAAGLPDSASRPEAVVPCEPDLAALEKAVLR